MSDVQRYLQRIAEEGAMLAARPPSAELRRRLRVRRGRTAVVAACAALVSVAGFVSAWREWREDAQPSVSPGSVPSVASNIVADPSTVRAGQDITVSGACDAGDTVIFEAGQPPRLVNLGQTVSDPQGRFIAHVRIRAEVAVGPSWLWAFCRGAGPTGKMAQTTPITVIPAGPG